MELKNIRTQLHKANLFGRIAQNKPYINKVNEKKIEFDAKICEISKRI